MSASESRKVNEIPPIRRFEDKKVQRLLAVLPKKIAQKDQPETPSRRIA